jgi:hypothetical protein
MCYDGSSQGLLKRPGCHAVVSYMDAKGMACRDYGFHTIHSSKVEHAFVCRYPSRGCACNNSGWNFTQGDMGFLEVRPVRCRHCSPFPEACMNGVFLFQPCRTRFDVGGGTYSPPWAVRDNF